MNDTLREPTTRAVGAEMMVASFLGLIINFYMMSYFSKLEKSGFYILCLSKTFSNCMSLCIYLFYAGPVNLFYTQIGPCLLDAYMNQILGYGLLLQGPATQFIITINRFYVICFSPVNIPAYSNHVTVAAIAVSWAANGWFGTLIGLPTDCLISFGFEHLDCIWYSDCGDIVGYYQIMIIFILAIANNSMNVIVAIKLFCTAKSLMKMSSGAAKNRRKLSIRFFIQSVVQDWICALDYSNSYFAMSKFCEEIYCIVFMTMGFDVLVYGLDGWGGYCSFENPKNPNLRLVMYLFNRNVEQKSERNSRPKVSDGPTLT
ncbi:hypothetical protein B9Z55_007364 [Caenorhabditis nigoni]|uniref:7TM GPCR serpentine receptor class x (Srx) domain-containing protein n=1 Tax=Caenorhabditis nigoni TaxID=1611254 RepID=A0A2G5V984_9PELO|nr:hypothetical protein B9Z55_007364 [Caenorhabditis nigoni]